MQPIKTHKKLPWLQVGLPILWVALLLTTPYLVAAETAPAPDDPIVNGVRFPEVTLNSFTASWTDSQILVEWKTGTELYNAGFNLYRREHEGRYFVRLNANLIPSQALSESVETTYQFVDTSSVIGQEYDYWLESVDVQGLPKYLSTTSTQVPVDDPPPPSQATYHAFLPYVRN